MIQDTQFITNHYGTDGLLKIVDTDYDSINNINYAVDYERFLYYTIPTIFRIAEKNNTIFRETLYYYLVSIIRVFQTDANLVSNIRKAILQRMNWNSQTLKLQQIMRDVFENDNIYINNNYFEIYNNYLFNKNESAPTSQQLYFTNKAESESVYLFKKRESKEYDVLITIDESLKTNDELIKAFLQIYTLNNKIFKIEYVSF